MSRLSVPRRFRYLTAGIGVVAVALWIASAQYFPGAYDERLVLLVLAGILAENLAVYTPSGTSGTSLSVPLSVAANLVGGPAASGAIAVASTLSLTDVRNRRPLWFFVFNGAQYMVAWVAAGAAYALAGGRLLTSGASLGRSEFTSLVPPLGVLVVASVLLNGLLVSVGIRFLRDTPIRQVWRESIRWGVTGQIALALLGVAVAQVISLAPVGFVLFLFPLLLARQMYQRYLGLRDAYRDTVRSLVAAIEAKDPYTRGHSERVAQYAVDIAKQMRLPERTVESIEFAALLHDLGKVGISGRILAKQAGLSAEEWAEVKTHPAIGARIVERVPYLAEIVDAVRSHHERFDGDGYGDGLKAAGVPLQARILAVADSYDAMTSERPYRPPLSREKAIDEVLSGRGTQFDPTVADAFLVTLDLANRGAYEEPPVVSASSVMVEDA